MFKYPIKIPTNEKYDEFDGKYEIGNLFKYTYNEKEFSTRHAPDKYKNVFQLMLMIDKIDSNSNETISLEFDDALSLTGQTTHLHKFDQVQMLSEPKVLFVNNTWYKLFYDENKSIEISCPRTANDSVSSCHLLTEKEEIKTHEKFIKEKNEFCSCVDFLVSDSLTGRYYTCYSLNEKTHTIDELKICIDNVPSFKQNLNRLLSYSNISRITNYLTCLDLANKKAKFDSFTENTEIKSQSVIPDVGHFKYFSNRTIFIQFIDKVKLYVDSQSIEDFNISNLNQARCLATIILPDLSQHEVDFSETIVSIFSLKNELIFKINLILVRFVVFFKIYRFFDSMA